MVIYGLIDPRNGELRYVGQTVRLPQLRLSQHLSIAKKGAKSYNYFWLRQLLAEGLKSPGFQ